MIRFRLFYYMGFTFFFRIEELPLAGISWQSFFELMAFLSFRLDDIRHQSDFSYINDIYIKNYSSISFSIMIFWWFGQNDLIL